VIRPSTMEHLLLLFLPLFSRSLYCKALHSPHISDLISAEVQVLDHETAVVNWIMGPKKFQTNFEIVYSPAQSSYYIVHPIFNPAATSTMLENLLPFTQYHLIIRTSNTTNHYFQTETIHFTTSVVTLFGDQTMVRPVSYANSDLILVLTILIIWGVVVSLFFQRWGKIRSLLPYQPVYSKEMAEKIEKIETEKTLRSNRASFSFFPLDCDCDNKHENVRLDRLKPNQTTFNPCNTTSTSFLPTTNSLDVDSDQLRKTKSAENISCPRIVIDKTLSRQVSSSNRSFPMVRSTNILHTVSHKLLEIPRKANN